MMAESWRSILGARFAVTLTDKESTIWALELANTFKGMEREQVNQLACEAMRFIADKDSIPRADAGRKAGRYTVSDLIKWIRIYKSERRIFDDRADMDQRDINLINKMKPVIVRWADQKRWDEIAFAIPMPCREMIHAIKTGATLSDNGQKQLETWVLMEYGLNCREHRIQWAKENSDRVMGLESGIGVVPK